jgi:hypothetical protein
MAEDSRPAGFVITKNTGISIGLVFAMAAPLVWAIVAKNDMDHALEWNRRSDELQTQAIAELRTEMRDGFKQLAEHGVTREAWSNWLAMLRAANEGAQVVFPDLPD